MATIVRLEELSRGDGFLRFQTADGNRLTILSLTNGNATVICCVDNDIEKTAEVISGCFDDDSNLNGFKSIEFEFKGINMRVTPQNCSVKQIVNDWMIKYANRSVALINSPYQIDILTIDETEEIEFLNEETEKSWREYERLNNKCGYRSYGVMFARRWAKCMQHIMKETNLSVDIIAGEIRELVDIHGITDDLYFSAVKALSCSWKYGEELRKWFNRKWEYEGKGVINPYSLE